MPQQVLLNLDQLDDPVLGDGTPSFAGGMVSNDQANLIGETESTYMLNVDRSRIGKATTRRGSVLLGGGPPGAGPIIQGMAYYWSGTFNYLVVASGGKLYRQSGGAWIQIATGGVLDNDLIDVVKTGRINNPGGYNVGDTSLVVVGFTGPVANGDKLILWQRDKGFEYTIASHTETGGNTTTIVLANPGLVERTYNNDELKVKRLGARVNNASGYPGGTTTIVIDGITGELANGDHFVIRGEEILHTITAHLPASGDTTSLTFTPAIQGQYVASSDTVPIIFALGGNKLFWTDGVGAIFSWDGRHTGNLANSNIYDTDGSTPAPTAVKWIAWFQNRLIAAGPASEPDAIFFSDFLDATNWDSNFQQIRVGGGESDPIVAVVPWMDMLLVVFKEHSIYVVNMDPSQNPDPTDPTLLVASYQIKLITHYTGCASGRAIVQLGEGGDILFLGTDRKVRSLRRVIATGNQQEMGQSVSLPIDDLLDRITPSFIQNSVAYYWNNRYMLGTPVDGGEYPQATFVFDTSQGNWSGVWVGWRPTAFCAKLVATGQQALAIGQSNNLVLQWLEDTSPDETDPDTYKDNGVDITTAILARAYSFGDLYNPKTGLNVEFEFMDSLATVNVSAFVDLATLVGTIGNFDTITFIPLLLPFTLPATLPVPTFKRIEKDLQRFGQFRELQIYIFSPAKKFTCRSIKLTAFMDSFQLQTREDTPMLDAPEPVPLAPFP